MIGRIAIAESSWCWCERGDLNPHRLPRQILSLVRLPISPLSHMIIKDLQIHLLPVSALVSACFQKQRGHRLLPGYDPDSSAHTSWTSVLYRVPRAVRSCGCPLLPSRVARRRYADSYAMCSPEPWLPRPPDRTNRDGFDPASPSNSGRGLYLARRRPLQDSQMQRWRSRSAGRAALPFSSSVFER
jgi:hypothetical protein